jgi:hypothetical protein
MEAATRRIRPPYVAAFQTNMNLPVRMISAAAEPKMSGPKPRRLRARNPSENIATDRQKTINGRR